MRYILFLLGFLPLTNLYGQTWEVTELAPMPEKVTNNAVAEGFIDGIPFVYSFGGLDATKKYSGIHLRSYRFNTQTNYWENIPPLPDTLGKIAAAASRVRNIIYIIGGYHVFADGHELSSNNVHRYDIINNRYLSDGAPLPLQIDDHVQAVWKDSLIFVITGWSDTENKPNVQIYNPFVDIWERGTPVPDDHDYKSFGASGVIVGDSIYYFCGAAYQKHYPAQNTIRIGIINSNHPLEIRWSKDILGENVKGYRMAATNVNGYIFWLGGSEITYNYDGISYQSKQGVPPLGRSLYFEIGSGKWGLDFKHKIPMDLRGIAEISASVKYIVGGMLDNQKVSDKFYKFVFSE